MRNAVITSLVFVTGFLMCQLAYAQGYTYNGREFLDSDLFSYNEDYGSYNKGYDDHMRLYNIRYDSARVELLVKDVSLNQLKLTTVDTIVDSRLDFFHNDILATDNYDVLLGNSKMFIYDRASKDVDFIVHDSIQYENINYINDSLVLLTSVFNYHPLNDFPGLHLTLYNIQTKNIIRHVVKKFNGIALSHMIRQWQLVNKNGIYIVNPLSGKLYKYNFDLDVVDTTYIPVNWVNAKANIEYESQLDSIIYANYSTVNARSTKYGKDSVRKNRSLNVWKVGSRDNINSIIKTTRSEYEYIEKLIHYNDSVIIVTVSRPGYDLQYRDVLFYNVNTNSLMSVNEKWRCGKPLTINKLEEFFVVDLINSNTWMPYFHDDKVYSTTSYNTSVFRQGSQKEVDKLFAKDVIKNKFRCKILEYSYR